MRTRQSRDVAPSLSQAHIRPAIKHTLSVGLRHPSSKEDEVPESGAWSQCGPAAVRRTGQTGVGVEVWGGVGVGGVFTLGPWLDM